MDELNLEKTLGSMRKYFDEGNTKSYAFRMEQLKKLKAMIKKNEKKILVSLYLDLHKPEFEAFTSEIGVLYEEVNYTMNHLRRWMKLEKTWTPLVLKPSKSLIYSEPLGVAFIIAPWNYPFQLALAPLIGAIGAGNCAVVLPSDQARYTSELIAKLIGETFSPEYIHVVQGSGAEIVPMLIEKGSFNHIFFTGSTFVGKKILQLAAAGLIPVTLELGGKSPAIVHEDADIGAAAKRIAWSKYCNAGQTCVSPDYVLIHEKVKDEFIREIGKTIRKFFGENPMESKDFGRIINEKRFDILKEFLSEGEIVLGGENDRETKYIAPTVIDGITMESRIMQEEIFGPILPVISYRDITEVVELVRKNRYPLALYLFTNNEKIEETIIERLEFGGGCINDGIVHLLSSRLPFGGVGSSGMGSYHGKQSFDTFSHKKSMVKTGSGSENPLKYPPYSDKKTSLARRFFK